MQNVQDHTVVVVGSGAMGSGIAHVFAMANFSVKLVDKEQRILEKAMERISANLDRMIRKEAITLDEKVNTLMNLEVHTDVLQVASHASIFIEAVPEKIQLKKDIFSSISHAVNDKCIVASNTSSISITELARSIKKPERFIGMHFMNPVPIMPLVEIIKGIHTEKEVTDRVVQISQELGKVPVVVNDYPGFVSNRILMPMLNEAITCLQEGVADVDAIDKIMKLGMAHPMGPLELADHIGLDVCLSILEVLHANLPAPKYAPSALLRAMVSANQLGKKTGRGFYLYDEKRKKIRAVNPFQN